MVRHLEAVRRRANDEGLGSRLALLGVTLDPAFDTPVRSARVRGIGAEGIRAASTSGRWRREPPRRSRPSPGSSASDTAPKAGSSRTR